MILSAVYTEREEQDAFSLLEQVGRSRSLNASGDHPILVDLGIYLSSAVKARTNENSHVEKSRGQAIGMNPSW